MIINELEKRGILADATHLDEMKTKINSGEKFTLYCGFDPTADSLHIGSLLPLMNLKRFADDGHTVIALIGGATGFIGDPSFKAAERQLNTPETIDFFKKGIKKQIEDFLGDKAIIVDNLDWVQNMNVIEFLRDVGKHFSVNQMMNKESVKSRFNRDEAGISFTEFSYQLLQGMDFWKLKESHNCDLQIGGSDQWGNITAGIDLIHKKMGNNEKAFGLTTKLVTKSDGTKFGKTESGTVWLSKEKTTPFDFYQFWLKTTDADVYTFLRFFSSLTVEEISDLEEADKNRKPEAQSILAKELTLLIHGQDGLEEALKITDAMINGSFSTLTENEIESVSKSIDTIDVKLDEHDFISTLVESGLAKSKKMAREFVTSNAISINGKKVSNLDLNLNDVLICNKFVFIQRGKRNLVCIKKI